MASPTVLSSSSLTEDTCEFHKDLINLKLKKPKTWNWELSTSKSSSSINFPRIRLYDHHDNLLAEADESEQLVNNTTHPHSAPLQRCSSKNAVRKKAESFNSVQQPSIRSGGRSKSRSQTMDMTQFLDGIRQEMLGQGFKCKVTERGRSSSRKRFDSGNMVNEVVADVQVTLPLPVAATNRTIIETTSKQIDDSKRIEQPITVLSERGLLQRDRQAKEFTNIRDVKASSSRQPSSACVTDPTEGQRGKIKHVIGTKNNIRTGSNVNLNTETRTTSTTYAMTKSKSAFDIPVGRLSGLEAAAPGTCRKKVYRRTHSSNSPSRFSSSILERFSVAKRRSSSTDSERGRIAEESLDRVDGDDEVGYKPPDYILRTCPAGTLIVCKDSFCSQRGRRRNVSLPRRSPQEFETKTQPQQSSPKTGTSNGYDKAIANIDNLISRAISSSSHPSSTHKNDPTFVTDDEETSLGKVKPLSTTGADGGTSRDELSSPLSAPPRGRHNNFEVTKAAAGRNCAGGCEEDSVRRRRGRKKCDWELVQRQRENSARRNGGRRRSASADSERFRFASEMVSSSDDDDGANGNASEQSVNASGWNSINQRGRERTRRSRISSSSRQNEEAKDNVIKGMLFKALSSLAL